MAALFILQIIFTFTVPSFWFNFPCEQQTGYWWISFYYLYFSAIWASLAYLIIYEHSKNLSEIWYCHKAFWVLNIIVIVIVDAVYYSTNWGYINIPGIHRKTFANLLINGLELIISGVIIGCMFKTKRKIQPYMPAGSIDNRSSIYGDLSINSEYESSDSRIEVKVVYQYNIYGNFSFEVKYL